MTVAIHQGTGTIHALGRDGVATLCGIDTTPRPHRGDPWSIGGMPVGRTEEDLCRRCRAAIKKGEA